MSFKREGNDDQWLSRLKKRRVTELLGENIPEEEALFMKNGRLCCLVCHHRPTFDTLEMLSIHRGGKKHEANAVTYFEKQRELYELREKRGHAMYVTNGKTLGAAAGTSVSLGLIKSEPYNPQVKKKRLKPNERKQTVQIAEEDSTEREGPSPDSTLLSRLPGNRRSYVSQPKAVVASTTQNNGSQSAPRPKPQMKGPFSGGPHQRLPQTISEYVRRTAALNKKLPSVKPYVRSGQGGGAGSNIGQDAPPLHNSTSVENVSQEPGPSKLDGYHQKSKTISRKNSKQPQSTQASQDVDNEKRRKLERYLQATSSGWKLDWTGQKWVRDEDVEFDSDEEPPELPSL